MEEVTAFKDRYGKLHPNRIDAATADLVAAFVKERGNMPGGGELPIGTIELFARLLARNQNERMGIVMAIEQFEKDRRSSTLSKAQR